MAKAQRNKTITLSPEDLERIARKNEIEAAIAGVSLPYKIIEASIKDDFCDYKYEITNGTGIGATHKVDDPNIIYVDLKKAMTKFNVHLAVIQCAFLHSNIEVDDIDKFHDHDITGTFAVTGFKISGSTEDERIQLIGIQYSSVANGRSDIKTHKIPMDQLGGYKWYNELRTVSDLVRREVSLYKEGFYVPATEEEEVKEDPAQLALDMPSSNGHDADFEKAKM